MKNIIITGANRGIGLQLTKNYSKSDHVFALCRTSSDELKKISNVTIIDSVDLLDIDSIENGVSQCPSTIDLLINNAGVLQRVGIESMDHDDIDKIKNQFNVNALAPLLVVHHAIEKLSDSAKVVLITSRMGSIQDNDSGSHYGYRMSKAALNMAGKSLSIDLRPKGVAVGIIHPGWVQTDMTGHTGHYTVEQSVLQIMDRINDLSIQNSGTFCHSDGQALPW